MRTALIAWDYPPSPSGLSTAAREIAESLAAAGAEVTVFTTDRTGASQEGPIRILGCSVSPSSRLGGLRRWAAAGHLAAPLAIRRAVLREHRRQPFAVVEATNWYAPAVLLARHVPLVTRNSTPAAYSRAPGGSLRDRLDGRFADRLERAQARGSIGLLSNTADHARRVAAEYGLDPAVPHAVAGLSLPPAMLRRGREAGYPEGEGPVRALFVGRAEHRKGFDMILGATARLDAEARSGALPPFRIALAGVPPEDLPGDLAPSTRERLEPLGRVPEERLAQLYEDAHLVLAPSRYESFGLVYQEAIAFGRPIVACTVDASGSLFVGDTGSGPLARTDTSEALADAMRPLLAEPGERRRLRANALRAAGRFTRETLGTETLALYRAALERQGRKG
ncbi:glycosyltransferase family 4 protein [Aureimonas jatrophae]|uniref:Glycosyltransferase involved in cell wall bisynthesis n=1 Tax=Aureimonas jatrophae TaxID=1166073 RepID=A0A1H0ER36_9HYPH|nr:glycosyltransferase family 4 protein [Aureimonas jatrophae]MBB3950352.1 glycosyltransferase involved in cell wall biosynthesis [Aureimonas jatrophae]SDN84937.1 Glycosyltransferase involved in cell wall bisynthesis [Aureimonas jatrophae]